MPQFYRKQNNIKRKKKKQERITGNDCSTYSLRYTQCRKFRMLLKSKLGNEKKKYIEKKKNCSCIIPLFRCLCVFLSSHEYFDIKFSPFFNPRVHFWKKKSYRTFLCVCLFFVHLSFFSVWCVFEFLCNSMSTFFFSFRWKVSCSLISPFGPSKQRNNLNCCTRGK